MLMALTGDPDCPTANFTDGNGNFRNISFDNEEFTESDAPWVRCSVRHAGRKQGTLGERARHDSYGHIFFQIFYPTGTATKEIDCVARKLATGFERSRLPPSFPADLYPWTIREGGAEGKWFMLIVEVPCTYYDRGE